MGRYLWLLTVDTKIPCSGQRLCVCRDGEPLAARPPAFGDLGYWSAAGRRQLDFVPRAFGQGLINVSPRSCGMIGERIRLRTGLAVQR